MNVTIAATRPRSDAGARADGGPAEDARFRRLLTSAAWARLPRPVRRRFTHALAPAETLIYAGEVAWTRLTALGRVYGQLARLVGAPLPLAPSGRVAAAVVVTEDERAGGQVWTRIYARPGRFAQVIQSTKRFAGPTGLEECVGAGVGMRLALAVENRALIFRSRGYFLRIAGRTFGIPAWLTPGIVEVVHREERDGRFSFTLTVTHPRFGRIVEQVAFFSDSVRPTLPAAPRARPGP